MSLPTSRTARALSTAAVLAAGAAGSVGLTGCQASMAGQTLPSPYYLRDDVQYFPSGPEFQFPNQVRAIEEFQLGADVGNIGGGAQGVAYPIGPIN